MKPAYGEAASILKEEKVLTPTISFFLFQMKRIGLRSRDFATWNFEISVTLYYYYNIDIYL